MENGRLYYCGRKNRRGSAVLALIAIVVLIVIIVGVKAYLKEKPVNPDLVNDLSPWKEWKWRQDESYEQMEASEEQPKLTEGMEFDTNVWIGEGSNTPRGEVSVFIGPDGSVGGSWYGHYYKTPQVNFTIMGGAFGGSVYPGKIYEDEDGADYSKLYLMAKGDFLIQETDNKKGTLFHRGGDIYVRGWLDSNSVITGEITITSDKKYFETFRFKALDEGKRGKGGL